MSTLEILYFGAINFMSTCEKLAEWASWELVELFVWLTWYFLPSVSLQVFCNHLLKTKTLDCDSVSYVAVTFHCAVCCSESSVALCESNGDVMHSSGKAKYCFQQIVCSTGECPETVTWATLIKLKIHIWALTIQSGRLN